MNLYRKIMWQQGMLLKPHHFQFMENNLGLSLNKTLINTTARHAWGVMDISLNRSLLQSGVISFDKFQVIFPDGEWVAKNINAVLVSMSFNPQQVTSRGRLIIYAGIKKLQENRSNVHEMMRDTGANLNEDIDKRFVSYLQEEEVYNLYQEDITASARSLNLLVNFYSELDLENLNDYVVLPVASLTSDDEGNIILDTDYFPPVPQIRFSQDLMSLTSQVFEMLRSSVAQIDSFKMRDLVNTEDIKAEDVAAFMTPTLIKYRFAIQTISAYISELKQILDYGREHPRDLFKVFHKLISELTAFTSDVSIMAVDTRDSPLSYTYDHFDYARAFTDFRDMVKMLLGAITVSDDMNVNCVHEAEMDTFSASIPEEFFHHSNRFFIVVISRESPESWLENFVRFSRVASSDKISEIVQRSLPGLMIQALREVPAGLPARQGATYFKLEQKGVVWDGIKASRSFAILWDSPPSDVRVDISVVRN